MDHGLRRCVWAVVRYCRYWILDGARGAMSSLPERIIEHAEALPEATPICPGTLLHLGKRAAVDQALSRLARSGRLMRIYQGVYMLPIPITGNSGASRSRRGWSRCGRSREKRLTRRGDGPGRGQSSLWCPRGSGHATGRSTVDRNAADPNGTTAPAAEWPGHAQIRDVPGGKGLSNGFQRTPDHISKREASLTRLPLQMIMSSNGE